MSPAKSRPAASSPKTQALYAKARNLIPGGTQLLSKRPEIFAPGVWPAYYDSAAGCEIVDLDGRRFKDFTTMGVGSCLLGYACPEVDEAVTSVIRKGSMSSLNSPGEVELAELLLAIHPWAERARFARTGGETIAIAIRLARAATGRSRVAICGYHGWHDWYLAANLAKHSSLDGQLLPGLQPKGVPRQLSETALTFRYNHIEELEAIFETWGNEVAAVIMEPMRMDLPGEDFLPRVRELTNKHGAALVFDEVTSGWRFQLGGIHPRFGVVPDLAVFAKAVSNGYPMGAVIGTANIMEQAQETFVSSTYWTEAIGPAAALATIRTMKAKNIWPILAASTDAVAATLDEAGKAHGIPLVVKRSEVMINLAFDLGEEATTARTLFTKWMLEEGFLASSGFYASVAHREGDLKEYDAAVHKTFSRLAKARQSEGLGACLDTPVAHEGFRRLT